MLTEQVKLVQKLTELTHIMQAIVHRLQPIAEQSSNSLSARSPAAKTWQSNVPPGSSRPSSSTAAYAGPTYQSVQTQQTPPIQYQPFR